MSSPQNAAIWIAAIGALGAVAVALIQTVKATKKGRMDNVSHEDHRHRLVGLGDKMHEQHMDIREIRSDLHRGLAENHKIHAEIIAELRDHVEWELKQKYMTPREIDEAIRQALEK